MVFRLWHSVFPNTPEIYFVDSLTQYKMTCPILPNSIFVYNIPGGALSKRSQFIHHWLLQISASSSLSVAEAAAQCSVGTVEEIRDRHSRRQMATLCTISLGAVCRYRISELPDSALTQIECWTSPWAELALWPQLASFLPLSAVYSKCTLLYIFMLIWLSFCSFCNANKTVTIPVTMIYLHLFVAWIKSQFPPPCCIVEYTQYVCGLSLCAYLCLSVPVGVVLFDSPIHSLLSLSLLSCL